MDLLNIVEMIEEERQRQGIDILSLSQQAGICRATYYHWIEDRVNPRVNQVSRVLDVLGMTVTIGRRA